MGILWLNNRHSKFCHPYFYQNTSDCNLYALRWPRSNLNTIESCVTLGEFQFSTWIDSRLISNRHRKLPISLSINIFFSFLSSLEQEQTNSVTKGHKLSAFSLKLAQLFLNTVLLLSRTWKTCNPHLEKSFLTANLENYSKKILLFLLDERSNSDQNIGNFACLNIPCFDSFL